MENNYNQQSQTGTTHEEKNKSTFINNEHKDRLFKKLFGSEENKESMLSLYNALNGSSYTDESQLQIYTIEDVIYLGMKNDSAYLLDGHMCLHEHQSTINRNLPLRGLFYFSKLYEKYIADHKLNIYTATLKKIPTPQFYVFYNGDTDMDDRVELRLSDAYIQPVHEGAYEWTAIVLNINSGHNAELLQKCETLKWYAVFSDKIREFRDSGLSIRDAVINAVDWCIENNILKSYFVKHKSEVIGMVLTEFDEKQFIEDLKKESYDSGYDSGIDKVNSLIRILFAQKRYSDLERSANDPKYQAQLIKELLP